MQSLSTTANKQALSFWQYLGIAITFLAFIVLYPGITKPLMTISADVNIMGFQANLFEETRSILETVDELKKIGYPVIAFLILTFSVIIPVFKALLILANVFFRKSWLWIFIAVLSKWSMADVFVVASIIAYFTAQSTVELQAQLHEGFYWFLAYCLLSIVSGQLLLIQRKL